MLGLASACSAPATPEFIPIVPTQIPPSVEPPQAYVSTNTPTIITPTPNIPNTPESQNPIAMFVDTPLNGKPEKVKLRLKVA